MVTEKRPAYQSLSLPWHNAEVTEGRTKMSMLSMLPFQFSARVLSYFSPSLKMTPQSCADGSMNSFSVDSTQDMAEKSFDAGYLDHSPEFQAGSLGMDLGFH